MSPIDALAKLVEIATPAAEKDPGEASIIHEAIVVLTRAIPRPAMGMVTIYGRRLESGDTISTAGGQREIGIAPKIIRKDEEKTAV